MYTIYGLSDNGGTLRYIGVSSKDAAYVLSHHRSAAKSAKRRTPVNEWVLSIGDRLKYKAIHEVTEEQKTDRVNAVIESLRSAGVDLLNVSKEEHAAKVRQAMSDPDVRKRISENGKGRVNTPEHRAAISRANKGRVISEEHRAIISKVHSGKVTSDETKAKIAEKARGHKRNAGRVHTQASKDRMSHTRHLKNHLEPKEGCRWCNGEKLDS